MSGNNIQEINRFQVKVNFSGAVKSKIVRIYCFRIPKVVELAFVLFMKEANSLFRPSGKYIKF